MSLWGYLFGWLKLSRSRQEPSPEAEADSSQLKQTWLLERIRFYRAVGFFSSFEGVSDEDLMRKFFDRIETFERFGPKSEWPDLELLACDQSRVWSDSLECDCQPGHYAGFLDNLASISSGIFQPQDINEKWESDTGPIRVSFTCDGQQQIVCPKFLDDYLDVGILDGVNSLIERSGFKFVGFYLDQQGWIMLLTPDAKRRIEQKVGWKFMSSGDFYRALG